MSEATRQDLLEVRRLLKLQSQQWKDYSLGLYNQNQKLLKELAKLKAKSDVNPFICVQNEDCYKAERNFYMNHNTNLTVVLGKVKAALKQIVDQHWFDPTDPKFGDNCDLCDFGGPYEPRRHDQNCGILIAHKALGEIADNVCEGGA